MKELDKVREATRPEVEAAAEVLRSRRRHLRSELEGVERELALAEAWLGGTKTPTTVTFDKGGSPLTLHAAMELVLGERGAMRPPDLTREINERGLYRMKDGRQVLTRQIHARARNYADVFEVGDGLIRLRDRQDG